MQRRSFLSLLGLAPLATAASAATQLSTPSPPALPPEPWQEGPENLERWRRSPRHPLWESPDAELIPLITALRNNHRIQFFYSGGTAPGTQRTLTPGHLYTVTDFPGHYLSGYCHLRQAERTFLVSRMSQLTTLSV